MQVSAHISKRDECDIFPKEGMWKQKKCGENLPTTVEIILPQYTLPFKEILLNFGESDTKHSTRGAALK